METISALSRWLNVSLLKIIGFLIVGGIGMQVVWGYLFIFGARLIDVSLGTIRTIMLFRGKRLIAALIGFFEVSIYMIALSRVVNTLNNPLNLFVYALGYATGNYLGSFLEEKLALGHLSVQVVTRKPESCEEMRDLAETLRKTGFGVTVIEGHGREGTREILHISLMRKDFPCLLEKIEQLDKDAFITVMDARTTKGGWFYAQNKKQKRK